MLQELAPSTHGGVQVRLLPVLSCIHESCSHAFAGILLLLVNVRPAWLLVPWLYHDWDPSWHRAHWGAFKIHTFVTAFTAEFHAVGMHGRRA